MRWAALTALFQLLGKLADALFYALQEKKRARDAAKTEKINTVKANVRENPVSAFHSHFGAGVHDSENTATNGVPDGSDADKTSAKPVGK